MGTVCNMCRNCSLFLYYRKVFSDFTTRVIASHTIWLRECGKQTSPGSRKKACKYATYSLPLGFCLDVDNQTGNSEILDIASITRYKKLLSALLLCWNGSLWIVHVLWYEHYQQIEILNYCIAPQLYVFKQNKFGNCNHHFSRNSDYHSWTYTKRKKKNHQRKYAYLQVKQVWLWKMKERRSGETCKIYGIYPLHCTVSLCTLIMEEDDLGEHFIKGWEERIGPKKL